MPRDIYPRTSTPLLGSMARDIREVGVLRQRTAVVMWGTYVLHAAVTGAALARTDGRIPAPSSLSRRVGGVVAAAGVGLCVAGMGRFSGFNALEGTQAQEMTTNGIYSWSRNPQYLGYLLALGGVSTARRSATGVALTAVATLAYASWVRVEEDQLHQMYGGSYDRYRTRTHRWFGRSTR